MSVDKSRQATRAVPRCIAWNGQAIEALCAFSCAKLRRGAPALLELLSEPWRTMALKTAQENLRGDSAARHANLCSHFGEREDAQPRVLSLLRGTHPALSSAVMKHLPPHRRPQLRCSEGGDFSEEALPERLGQLAARLAEEALF